LREHQGVCSRLRERPQGVWAKDRPGGRCDSASSAACRVFRVHFRHIFAMLSEDEVRRISELKLSDPVVKLWIERLLDERRHLVAVIQGLARQLHHLRGRMKQAAAYLDGLAEKAELTARTPWPSKIPCPRCGAPVDRLVVDYRPQKGHTLLHRHTDGTVCEPKTTNTI